MELGRSLLQLGGWAHGHVGPWAGGPVDRGTFDLMPQASSLRPEAHRSEPHGGWRQSGKRWVCVGCASDQVDGGEVEQDGEEGHLRGQGGERSRS